MSVDRQREIVSRIVEEAYNHGKLDVIDECIAPDFRSEMLPEELGAGPAAFKRMVSHFRTAFPDLQVTIDDEVSDRGKIVTRWTVIGTHEGTFIGVQPTDISVRLHGISIWYLRGDQVVDFWDVMDRWAFHQQVHDIK